MHLVHAYDRPAEVNDVSRRSSRMCNCYRFAGSNKFYAIIFVTFAGCLPIVSLSRAFPCIALNNTKKFPVRLIGEHGFSGMMQLMNFKRGALRVSLLRDSMTMNCEIMNPILI